MKLDMVKRGSAPHSPILEITIQNDAGDSCDASGLIDTGADRTFITKEIVERLGLRSKGKVEMGGIGGKVCVNKYYVHVKTDFTRSEKVLVCGPYEVILIGRDLINQWRLEIDGCDNTFTIEPCSRSPLRSDPQLEIGRLLLCLPSRDLIRNCESGSQCHDLADYVLQNM